MLSFLLDAHISPKVSRQLSHKNPNIAVFSLQQWKNGRYLQASDDTILEAAIRDALTLVTYDCRTIPGLLKDFSLQNRHHAGVIFIDNRTIKPDDIGGLVKSLAILWQKENKADWTDRNLYLQRL